MIDLHTHSIFSDGELLPSELIRRAQDIGYEAIAITDHADLSNIDFIIPRILKVCKEWEDELGIKVIPGIELTHIPPVHIPKLEKEARRLGARIVIVHGETIIEPVAPGTNRAAIESRVDILAHPGLISEEEAEMAKKNSVYLELTSRKGHSLTNGWVAKIAEKVGAKLIINTDSHSPSDLINDEEAEKIVLGSGLSKYKFNDIILNSKELLNRVMGG